MKSKRTTHIQSLHLVVIDSPIKKELFLNDLAAIEPKLFFDALIPRYFERHAVLQRRRDDVELVYVKGQQAVKIDAFTC